MPAQSAKIILPISGMSCASCVGRVEKALSQLVDISDVEVNLATESARFAMGSELTMDAVQSAVSRAGFGVVHKEADLIIDGMTCAGCVARVEKALLKDVVYVDK